MQRKFALALITIVGIALFRQQGYLYSKRSLVVDPQFLVQGVFRDYSNTQLGQARHFLPNLPRPILPRRANAAPTRDSVQAMGYTT
jgi:hypothetical protein